MIASRYDRCVNCPVDAGFPCAGGVFCAWAASGDLVLRRHIIAVSATSTTLAAPETPVDPEASVPDMPTHNIPLAGDLVAAAAHRLGADRVAKWVAKRLGAHGCGCERRQQAMNRMDATLRRYLGKG